MKLTLWGTRGSIASAGPETVRYGGNTACVEVRADDGRLLIFDAGSGIRRLGTQIDDESRVDILLSHLHMDHVQGLPFFGPLLEPDVEVHLWGPISTTRTLRERLARYLSPPLFPVRVRDLPNVHFHDVLPSTFHIGGVQISADLITHPGATLGYRLEENGRSLAYMPDHEPALGNCAFPGEPEWTSGIEIAQGVDALIHDAQYTSKEYVDRVGWGHTSFPQLATYVQMAAPSHLITFHHDPSHDDDFLDAEHAKLAAACAGLEVSAGSEGLTVTV